MKKKYLYVIFLVITIIIVSIIIVFNNLDENKEYKDYGNLIEVSYSCSGDMLGNVLDISLDLTNNKVEYLYAISHDEHITKTVYSVDKTNVNSIKKLVDAYRIADLNKLDIDDKLFVYDACTPTLALTYKTGKKDYNREYYSVSYYYNIDIVKRNIINEIRDDLYHLLIKENIIESLIVEND